MSKWRLLNASSSRHYFLQIFKKISILFADSKSSSTFALYKLFNT